MNLTKKLILFFALCLFPNCMDAKPVKNYEKLEIKYLTKSGFALGTYSCFEEMNFKRRCINIFGGGADVLAQDYSGDWHWETRKSSGFKHTKFNEETQKTFEVSRNKYQ